MSTIIASWGLGIGLLLGVDGSMAARAGRWQAPRVPAPGRSRRLAVSAPARANVLGNPSDQYGGSQISCSVPLRARASVVASGATEGLRVASGGETLRVASAEDLAPRGDLFDLPRAVLAALGAADADGGESMEVEITLESEIPLQSGLAGSTALVVALLHALRVWRGAPLPLHALAEEAREIESTRMGVTCGFGDQYMAAFGGLRFLDFRGKAPADPTRGEAAVWATVEDLAPFVPRPLPFVLAFTGKRHFSGGVHRPIRERWLAGERAVVEGYARVAALGRAGKRALALGDWPRFGALMNENHAIQRDLGGSGESNEALIAAALAAGALGAKLAGAGDGGTIVALARDDAHASALALALRAAGAAETWRPEAAPGVRVDAGAG
jgi:galactokinase/mevalonate kinase-like predicted kinase